MSDFQHYLTPADAATKLELTEQQLIDRVLWFDSEPERIPLYCRMPESCLAHWALDPEFDHAGYTGAAEGSHELSAGRYFEIHPHDGHELAANPSETRLVQRLRSPAFSIGAMPARSVMILWKADAIPMNLADCWIGENSLSRATHEAGRRIRQLNLLARAVESLQYSRLAIPRGGKRAIFEQCTRFDKSLIHEGCFETAFEKVWKTATRQGLVKSAV